MISRGAPERFAEGATGKVRVTAMRGKVGGGERTFAEQKKKKGCPGRRKRRKKKTDQSTLLKRAKITPRK